MESNPTPGELVSAALAYAARGWPVLPLVSRGKRPLTTTGLLEASVDPHTLGEWWSRWPHANIGLRTGVAFDVLDLDGPDAIASMLAKTGPDTGRSGPVSRTGKGEHWLYLPGNTANKAGLLPKVDWRGTNGYIVAPPSQHPEGHQYQWLNGPDTPLRDVPDWLAPLLTPWTDRGDYVEPKIVVLKTNEYQSKNPQEIIAYGMDRVSGRLIDIVATAHELGYHPRADGGGRYAIHCPFHEGDNEASMKLYTRDNSFYCFGCQAWGDSVNLTQHRPGGHRASG